MIAGIGGKCNYLSCREHDDQSIILFLQATFNILKTYLIMKVTIEFIGSPSFYLIKTYIVCTARPYRVDIEISCQRLYLQVTLIGRRHSSYALQ